VTFSTALLDNFDQTWNGHRLQVVETRQIGGLHVFRVAIDPG
jgi:hypothetical protein